MLIPPLYVSASCLALRHGADHRSLARQETTDGETALEMAMNNNNTDLMILLQRYEDRPEPGDDRYDE